MPKQPEIKSGLCFSGEKCRIRFKFSLLQPIIAEQNACRNAKNRIFPFSFPFSLDFREKTVTLSVNGITDHCF